MEQSAKPQATPEKADNPTLTSTMLVDTPQPKPTATLDIESQIEQLEGPLYDGPAPPHPHPHFSSRAPWLRAGALRLQLL